MRKHLDRDWPEDSHLENGNYTSLCALCGYSFTGHKRRYVCKECSTMKRSQGLMSKRWYARFFAIFAAWLIVSAVMGWW